MIVSIIISVIPFILGFSASYSLDTQEIFTIASSQIASKKMQIVLLAVLFAYGLLFLLFYYLRNKNIITIFLFVVIQDLASGIKTVFQVFVGVTIVLIVLWIVKDYSSVNVFLIIGLFAIIFVYTLIAAYFDMFFEQKSRPLSELLRRIE